MMRTSLALATTAMIALAAPAFAQQTLQPGSPGVGAGGQQPYTGGPSDKSAPVNGGTGGMSEGRAAAPDDAMRGNQPNNAMRGNSTAPNSGDAQ